MRYFNRVFGAGAFCALALSVSASVSVTIVNDGSVTGYGCVPAWSLSSGGADNGFMGGSWGTIAPGGSSTVAVSGFDGTAIWIRGFCYTNSALTLGAQYGSKVGPITGPGSITVHIAPGGAPPPVTNWTTRLCITNTSASDVTYGLWNAGVLYATLWVPAKQSGVYSDAAHGIYQDANGNTYACTSVSLGSGVATNGYSWQQSWPVITRNSNGTYSLDGTYTGSGNDVPAGWANNSTPTGAGTSYDPNGTTGQFDATYTTNMPITFNATNDIQATEQGFGALYAETKLMHRDLVEKANLQLGMLNGIDGHIVSGTTAINSVKTSVDGVKTSVDSAVAKIGNLTNSAASQDAKLTALTNLVTGESNIIAALNTSVTNQLTSLTNLVTGQSNIMAAFNSASTNALQSATNTLGALLAQGSGGTNIAAGTKTAVEALANDVANIKNNTLSTSSGVGSGNDLLTTIRNNTGTANSQLTDINGQLVAANSALGSGFSGVSNTLGTGFAGVSNAVVQSGRGISNAVADLLQLTNTSEIWSSNHYAFVTNSPTEATNKLGLAIGGMQSAANAATNAFGMSSVVSAVSGFSTSGAVEGTSPESFDIELGAVTGGGGHTTTHAQLTLHFAPWSDWSVSTGKTIASWFVILWLFIANYKVYRVGMIAAFNVSQVGTAGTSVVGSNINFMSALTMAGFIVAAIGTIPAVLASTGLSAQLTTLDSHPFTALAGSQLWGWVSAALPVSTLFASVLSHIGFRVLSDVVVTVASVIIKFMVGL